MKQLSILAMSQDPAFEYVARQSFDVWPGWGQLHIYRDKATGDLWGAREYISDDTSTGQDPTNWFRVKEVQIVRYEEIT